MTPKNQPIDFDVQSNIVGAESQILTVQLEPGQILRAESGAMLFMTMGIEMTTTLGGGSTSNDNTTGSGTTMSLLSSGFKRMLTGQNLFVSDFTYAGPSGTKGTVGFGTDFPSKILRFSLPNYGHKLICQKGAFLASSTDVQIELEFTKKLTTGFFGGEGFILQALLGHGDVFCKAGGTVIKKELQEGQTLRVSSGALVAFTQDVEFDVQMMTGFKNVLFGGEGLFVTTLRGPGTVWLQSMPPDRMISEIARRIPSGGIGFGIPIGLGGGSSTSGGEIAADSADPLSAQNVNTAGSVDNAVPSPTLQETRGDNTIDSDSSTALFGDAAPKDIRGDSPTSSSNTFDDSQETGMDDKSFDISSKPVEEKFDDFIEDDTSFSTESNEEEFTEDNESFTVESSSVDEQNSGGIWNAIKDVWNFFNKDE